MHNPAKTDLGQGNFLNTYARNPIVFSHGDGAMLYDVEGREYIDLLGGIAVVSVGHGDKFVADAIADQARKLTHVSNLFWTEPMVRLSEKLNAITGWGHVFLCNSGAEANECAIKLSRKWGSKTGKYKMVCADGGFHGRTLASLAATGQPAKWEGFAPLPAGFSHAPYNNLEAFEKLIDDETVGVWIEPIQGENGIIPASKEFMVGLRELTEKRGLLLIVDEIQSGFGRTGSWWAFQNYGITPDVFCTAKGLANGIPIGACIASDKLKDVFKPGDHGSTFGGGPIPSRAALATIEQIESKGLIKENLRKFNLFEGLLKSAPEVKEVRGAGLMIGVEITVAKAAEVAKELLKVGVIVNAPRATTLRLLPPYVISDSQILDACSRIRSILNQVVARGC